MLIIKDKHNKPLPWDINRFPDGQIQFKILHADAIKAQSILTSIVDSQSLDIFLQCVYDLKKVACIENVTINYFYGARSDKNVAGDYDVTNVAEYLERIIDSISDTTVLIDNNDPSTARKISYPTVCVLAPHCKLKKPIFSNYRCAWLKFNNSIIENEYDAIVFPDESAKNRLDGEVNLPQIICEKHRDQESGKIISHKIPALPDNVKKVLIFDDLCDFGNTFTHIGNSVPSSVKADLFVFHGVFTSNAIPRLLGYYDKIIVTNSLPAPEDQKSKLSSEDQERVQILNVW
jgi:hypothetical protein